MKSILLTVFIFSIILFAHVNNSYSMAQISMQNNTSRWLNLYIDGYFGCGPVMPSGFCTSSVKPGSHDLEARKGQEVVATEKAVNIGDGTSPIWTVTLEDPDQALIKRLNGTRFVNRSGSSAITFEDELVVSGTTLVWRKMVVSASSQIKQAILSGTGGFWNRTIGQWEEYARMQIVGRDAHYRRVTSYGAVDYICIINEDGKSITVNSTDIKFGRQTTIFRSGK